MARRRPGAGARARAEPPLHRGRPRARTRRPSTRGRWSALCARPPKRRARRSSRAPRRRRSGRRRPSRASATAPAASIAPRAWCVAAGAWSGARTGFRPGAAAGAAREGGDPDPAGRAAPPCARVVVSERVYLVPRGDGRLIVGATVEERGFDTAVTAGGVHELLREAYRALPEVAELELEEATAGLRPGTPDNAPLIGPGAIDGLFLATGHYRNGILLAPATAEAIAAALAGDEPADEVSVADPARFAATAAEGVAAP